MGEVKSKCLKQNKKSSSFIVSFVYVIQHSSIYLLNAKSEANVCLFCVTHNIKCQRLQGIVFIIILLYIFVIYYLSKVFLEKLLLNDFS